MLLSKVERADIYLHVRYTYTVKPLVFFLTVPTSWIVCWDVYVYGTMGPVHRTVHTHHGLKITLPNTDQAHNKHLWNPTNNFSQVQLYTPWWWIAYVPKHVGVIFNFMYFKLLYNVDF